MAFLGKNERGELFARIIDTAMAGYKTRKIAKDETYQTADYDRCLKWRDSWIASAEAFGEFSTLQNVDFEVVKKAPLKGLYGVLDMIDSINHGEFHGAQARTLACAIAVLLENGGKGVFIKSALKYEISESAKIKKFCADILKKDAVNMASALGTQLSSVCGKGSLFEILQIGKYEKGLLTVNEKSPLVKWVKSKI